MEFELKRVAKPQQPRPDPPSERDAGIEAARKFDDDNFDKHSAYGDEGLFQIMADFALAQLAGRPADADRTAVEAERERIQAEVKKLMLYSGNRCVIRADVLAIIDEQSGKGGAV